MSLWNVDTLVGLVRVHYLDVAEYGDVCLPKLLVCS